jgi:hypothetical protein
MNDDQPLPENPASRFWMRGPFARAGDDEFRRMAAFIVETSGSALALDPATNLPRMSREELIALAIRAQKADLGEDVVGTILTFAVGRGSSVAIGALAQMFVRRLEFSTQSGESSAKRLELRRVLRELDRRLCANTLLDEFDAILKELQGAGDAIALAETWATFRRSQKTGATHRVLAPALKSLKHLESGGEEFKILTSPVPFWRSPVSSAVLAKVLVAEFPHFGGAADEIANFVAGGAAASVRPILLVGPPAIGKDSVLRRAAELVGRPLGEFDLAGSSDNRVLKGTSRGWSTAHPAYATALCAQHRCANPIVQLSELDRAGGSRRNGMVHETLLALCEPSTRKKWFDDGLGVEVDLSDLAIAFTANGIDDTPAALLSRLRVLHLERPGPEHVEAILLQAQRRYAAEIKVPFDALPEPMPEVIERLKTFASQGRFHLRIADRIARALGDGQERPTRH